MSLTLEQLAEEAMHLPSADRAELAEMLFESLGNREDDGHRSVWAAEAHKRVNEVREGLVQTVSREEVLEKARRIVGR